MVAACAREYLPILNGIRALSEKSHQLVRRRRKLLLFWPNGSVVVLPRAITIRQHVYLRCFRVRLTQQSCKIMTIQKKISVSINAPTLLSNNEIIRKYIFLETHRRYEIVFLFFIRVRQISHDYCNMTRLQLLRRKKKVNKDFQTSYAIYCCKKYAIPSYF